MFDEAGEQVGGVLRARQYRRRSRFKRLVDDGEARVEGGAVLVIDGAVHDAGEAHRAVQLIDGEIVPGDGDQATALGQPRQRRAHVMEIGLRHPALHIHRCREGRVHENDRRRDIVYQSVIDAGGVMRGNQAVREQPPQKRRPRIGDLVERQPRAGDLGEDGEKPRAGRRLQHDVGGCDAGGQARHIRQWQWRAELLECFGFLAAAGVGGKKSGNAGQHGELCGGRARLLPHRSAILAQEQHLRGFASFVCDLPGPEALGVRTAERLLHRLPQEAGVDEKAAFETDENALRRLEDAGDLFFGRTDGCGGRHRRRWRHKVHEIAPGLRFQEKAGAGSLLPAPGPPSSRSALTLAGGKPRRDSPPPDGRRA